MSTLRLLTNLLYPPACSLCQTRLRVSQHVLCETCREAMPASGPPVCHRCGVPIAGAFDARMECAACRKRPTAFEMARAPWRYDGLARDAIRQFKYHRRWRLGRWLAEEMTTLARASLPLEDVDVVLPVPLHWLKARLRGYNPAGQLADAVARAVDKPYRPRALRRTRWTTTQTRLQGRQRLRNVRGAFAASPRHVRHRTILLVDDVLTSGATVAACATALRRAGARRVFVLTAARASHA